jgi:hypothetical protein
MTTTLKAYPDRDFVSSETLITLPVFATITIVSVVAMLLYTSPEFSWDEADYLAQTANHWGLLWGGFGYDRHAHGPMAIYLAKLGQEMLPTEVGSLEDRSRFFAALLGSMAIGFLYWTLRHSFRTSRAAAFVGSGLLLFSAIRVEETPIIGPHHLMLACTLAICGLGYQWRNTPTLQPAIGLGTVMAFGALSMTYVIPAGLCWAVAVSLAGREWIAWDRTHFKVSWSLPIMLAIAAIFIVVLWPPGLLHHVIIREFWGYVHLSLFSHGPILVGDRIFEVAPRWAAAYWLAHLDAPILVISTSIVLIALWRAFKRGHVSSKNVYLAVFLAFFLVIALNALMAGRHLLQFIGVLCLATGALFDEALGRKPLLTRFGSAAVVIAAGLNLMLLSRISSYTPSTATDGYRAFLKDNDKRLRENTKALVYGLPILKLYAQEYDTSIAWDVIQANWTTRADDLPPGVKYVLIPAFYDYMPAEQPMRRVVADHWKVAWSFTPKHAWELRLYQNPQLTEP